MPEDRNVELIPYLAAIVDSADDAIIGKDLNGIITTWNRAAETIFGYSAEEVIGKPITILAVSQVADEMPRILNRIRNGERIAHFETTRRHKDGSEIPISLTVSPIKDADGNIIGACKIVRDITERRRMDDQLRNSLAEKQVLLQEVHHRVKNNLNIIAALLSMQANGLEDASTVEKLRESEGRVMSMAMIHEQLYLQQDMSSIDLAEYVQELTTQLFAALARSGGITYKLETVATPLTIEQAIPCGLILNELITNALKYAYPHGRGTILIRVGSDRKL